LVVSPVSLTEEELALQKGARPKMPTLLGLGAALGEPSLPLEGPAPDDDGPYDSLPGSAAATAGGAPALRAGGKDMPEGFASRLELLTDFVLKLSLGPLSALWVDDARRAAEMLRAVAMRRQQSALTLLSGRLEQALDSVSTDDLTTEAPAAQGDAPAAHADAPAAHANAPAAHADAPAAHADAPAAHADAPAAHADAPAAQGDVPAATADAPAAEGAAAQVAVLAVPVIADGAPTETAASEGGTAPSDTPKTDPVTADATASISAAVDPERGTSAVSVAERTSEGPAARRSPAANGPAPRCIEGSAREKILLALSELPALLPEWPEPVRNLARETRRREQGLVRELLAAVDGLHPERRTRMTRQMRLDQLISATPETLARAFDAPLERARELSRTLVTYRMERQAQPPDVGNWLGLEQALSELSRSANEFEDCDEEERKEQRLARQRRRRASTRVDLLLAERGELDLLKAIEPCCVSERIERLLAWLASETERRGQG
jgi:hypothetical protein